MQRRNVYQYAGQQDAVSGRCPQLKIGDIIESDRPDCILLGPQVKYMYEETVAQYGKENIPIAVIDAAAYGMMDGEKVLKTAVKLIKENK